MAEELETRLDKALAKGDRQDKQWRFQTVALSKEYAETVAKTWRDGGHNARLVSRTLKVFGMSTSMYAVMVAEKTTP